MWFVDWAVTDGMSPAEWTRADNPLYTRDDFVCMHMLAYMHRWFSGTEGIVPGTIFWCFVEWWLGLIWLCVCWLVVVLLDVLHFIAASDVIQRPRWRSMTDT